MMKSLKRIVIFLYFFIINYVVGSDSRRFPTVTTKYGVLKGFFDKAVNGREFSSFTGIPFAAPPVGDLRFKDPVPLKEEWTEELDATKQSPLCPQYDMFKTLMGDWSQMFGQEDCLYLNVFTPKVSNTEKLPVMVFIHGGAFIVGGAMLYPPHGFMSEDVVLVVIQYRIGFLGFLSTEDEASSGNFGLKDQTESLRWIKENIANFGGDPNMITIFGESAGAASVHLQMLTEESKGLFNRAIIQSGTANCFWGTTENARNYAYDIGNKLKCSEDVNTLSSQQLVDCLRQQPVAEITKAYGHFMEFGMFPIATLPVIDGKYLKDHPVALMKDGDHQVVDLMAGYNKDEGAFISSQIYTYDHMFKSLHENFNDIAPISLGILPDSHEPLHQAIVIYKQYFGKTISFKDQSEYMNELFGDRLFKVCMENAKLFYMDTAAANNIQSYWYEFEYRGEMSYIDPLPMRHLANKSAAKQWVSHADELPYLFPGAMFLPPISSEEDKKISNTMLKLWTNFAKTGNPTPNEELGFTWSPSTETSNIHLSIDETPEMEGDEFKDKLKFWNSFPLTENIKVRPEEFDKMLSDLKEKKDKSDAFTRRMEDMEEEMHSHDHHMHEEEMHSHDHHNTNDKIKNEL